MKKIILLFMFLLIISSVSALEEDEITEKIDDFKYLKEFIAKHKLDRITFYRLKPQKNTPFENKQVPETPYYLKWIKQTRLSFPNIEIVVGSWLTHLTEIHSLLKSGADSITKFPSIRKFNTKYAKTIEQEAVKANRNFIGTLTKIPKININKELYNLDLEDKLKNKIKIKLKEYLKRMKNN